MKLHSRPIGAALVLFAISLTLRVPAARAEIVPDSQHQLYQTFAFLTDEQSSLISRSGGYAYGEVGGAFALYGIQAIDTQLVVHGSALAAYQVAPSILLTQTVDARVGLSLDHPFTSSFRGSLGWTHWSGHISDDVPDKDLIGPNSGDEQLYARVIYDWQRVARVGATLKPIVGSDPGMMAFAADQFAELYPWGTAASVHSPTPYIAVGCEEYGVHAVDFTVNVQAGIYFGDHLDAQHHPELRVAVGYYNGVDPRLKYMQFKDSFQQFGYFGVLVDF